MKTRGLFQVCRFSRSGQLIAVILLLATAALGQEWDLGARGADAISSATDERVHLSVEQRGRYEERSHTTFGKDVDIDTGLIRTRIGLTYIPVEWFKISGMAQDSRAPWYGKNAPNTVRDPVDLQEGYVELFPSTKEGFGMTAGRMMLNYGEGRLIGTPQWANLSRTYDNARIYWRTPKMQTEILMVSPVKIRIGDFNYPDLGDRVIGTYEVFPNIYRKNLLDAYYLRHDQNRIGGFTGGSTKDGTDTLAVNTFGFRATGPLVPGVKYSLEAALQKGVVGPADLSAGAWFASVSRRWSVAGRTLDLSVEYKYASGTKNPADTKHTGTFDQLYAANHDKFGHEDLFGWKNLYNARSFATYALTKSFALNFMYDSYWLADLKDGIYNISGKLIVRSPTGTAGRHVGQEADIFGTYKYKHFTWGAGYGYFFSGEFIQKTTPGVGPVYMYIFHTYTL